MCPPSTHVALKQNTLLFSPPFSSSVSASLSLENSLEQSWNSLKPKSALIGAALTAEILHLSNISNERRLQKLDWRSPESSQTPGFPCGPFRGNKGTEGPERSFPRDPRTGQRGRCNCRKDGERKSSRDLRPISRWRWREVRSVNSDAAALILIYPPASDPSMDGARAHLRTNLYLHSPNGEPESRAPPST